jgi:hypothetical protein
MYHCSGRHCTAGTSTAALSTKLRLYETVLLEKCAQILFHVTLRFTSTFMQWPLTLFSYYSPFFLTWNSVSDGLVVYISVEGIYQRLHGARL